MLVVWTKCSPAKTYSALSPVLKFYPQQKIQVVKDFSIPPGCKGILALGNESVDYLAHNGILPKGRKVTGLRGLPKEVNGLPLILSYNPDVGDMNHDWYVHMLTDVGLMMRQMTTGSFAAQYGKYRWVPDFSEIKQRIEALSATRPDGKVDVSFDTETFGKDPFNPVAYIVVIQVSCEIGKSDLVRFNSQAEEETGLKGIVGDHVQWLLTCPFIRLKGANFKYDSGWVWTRSKKSRPIAINCTNLTFDTTLVGSLLDENRSNGLDVHCKIYAPELGGYSDKYDMTWDKGRMDLVLANHPDDMLLYAGGDTDATLRVAEREKQELLADPQLTAFYVNILHPASRAFEVIERGGVFVDKDAYKELEFRVDERIDQLMIGAKRLLGGRIVAKYWDASKRGGLNLSHPGLIKDYFFSPMGLNLKPKMYTEKAKTPSTSLDHVKMFFDVPEAQAMVELYENFGKTNKIKTTYIGDGESAGFLMHLRSDGRFHPNYFLYVGDKNKEDEGGAVTGRLSAKDPAFQTIPKHSEWAKLIRRCFIAPPGYVVEERDYSQGELRVIACIANCLSMLEIYKQGLDLHIDTAAGVVSLTYDQLAEKETSDPDYFAITRQKGKAGNFGLVFGMQAEGFVEYARKNYRVIMTVEEATEFRQKYFAGKPELLEYHKVYRAFAKNNGYVRGPLGRIRHLPMVNSPLRELASKAERQAINSPVQMTLTDMMLWALGIETATGLSDVSIPFGSVHDSCLNYTPEDKVDEIVPRHQEIMENLPFELVNWHPQLKFLADVKIGKNMADLKKYKPAKKEMDFPLVNDMTLNGFMGSTNVVQMSCANNQHLA